MSARLSQFSFVIQKLVLRSSYSNRLLSSTNVIPCSSMKNIQFDCGDGHKFTAKGKIGDSLLDVVINNDLALDGFGACEGTLACCTCHVILEESHFNRVNRVNPISEEEMDLLDMAPQLHDRSRLGCQIKIASDDDDMISIIVPTQKRDARLL